MSYQSATIYKDVLHTRIQLASMGIEYVQVNSADTTQLCDYCAPMHGSTFLGDGERALLDMAAVMKELLGSAAVGAVYDRAHS